MDLDVMELIKMHIIPEKSYIFRFIHLLILTLFVKKLL